MKTLPFISKLSALKPLIEFCSGVCSKFEINFQFEFKLKFSPSSGLSALQSSPKEIQMPKFNGIT